MTRRGDPWIIAASLSLVAALVASGFLLFAPTVAHRGESVAHGQDFVLRGTIRSQRTLVEAQGWSVVTALAIPVAVASIPLVLSGTHHHRAASVASAVLLSAWVFLTGFSIGLFYLPAALLMILSAVTMPSNASSSRPA